MPLRRIVALAHGSSNARVSGPDGLLARKVSLAYTVPQGNGVPQGLLREALRYSYGIETSVEDVESDVYVLSVAPGGVRGLRPGVETPAAGVRQGICEGWTEGRYATMGSLARALEFALGRPVVDETKLAGTYDFDLTWDGAPAPAGLVRALEEEMGLRVAPGRRVVETVVVRLRGVDEAAMRGE